MDAGCDRSRDKRLALATLNVIEPLLTVDYDATVSPGLATDWHMVNDRTWEFTLREGVTFHDGTEVTAETVLPSLTRAFESSSMAAVPVESVEAAADRTIIMQTSVPFSPLPAHCTRGITCPVSPSAIANDGSITEPIGTGPFQFEDWEPGSTITTTATPDYHGSTAHIETLIYEGITDDQTRRLKLENGELDMHVFFRTRQRIHLHPVPISLLTRTRFREPIPCVRPRLCTVCGQRRP